MKTLMSIKWWVVILAVLMVEPVAAAEDHGKSAEEIRQEILQTQGVSEEDQINCQAVSEEAWEKLGDAVMEMMIGNSRQHEAMDMMMGGEGSESLQAMHVGMGQRYLGCGDSSAGAGKMGMMGGMMSMMGGQIGQGMMGSSGTGWGGWGPGAMGGWGSATTMLFWLVVIVGMGWLAGWLLRGGKRSRSGKQALDILAERYAKGEIDKQEFEIKKKDLET